LLRKDSGKRLRRYLVEKEKVAGSFLGSFFIEADSVLFI